MRTTARRSTAILAACILGLGAGAGAAEAASTSLSGTVNCNAARTIYATVRYMQQPSRTDLYLAQSAGGSWSGYSMFIGTYIVATGAIHEAFFGGADSYGTLQASNNYVVNTRFRMSARMDEPSAGTCSNAWSGTLTY